MMRRGTVIAGIVALAALSACGSNRFNDYTFDGERFRGKASAVERGALSAFVVEVSPVSASLDGARQAAEFHAVKYCVDRLGSSDIRWEVSPYDDTATLPVQDDRLTLRGECVE